MIKSLGFRIQQWLIAAGIIALLGGMAYVAWDPRGRAAQERDDQRQHDVEVLIQAVKTNKAIHAGSLHPAIASLIPNDVYMIVQGGGKTQGCVAVDRACLTSVTGDDHCVNLEGLVNEQLIDHLPIAPAAKGKKQSWDRGQTDMEFGTGYTIERKKTDVVVIRACEMDHADEIVVTD